MRRIDEIIVHCTATRAGSVVTAADVDAWHKERGFDGIGYHYLVGPDGKVEEGRSIERAGAHCRGRNARSIGVCYVGGLDASGMPKDTRTEKQKEALRGLIMKLRARYGNIAVRGHCDYAAKACPCFDAQKEFKK